MIIGIDINNVLRAFNQKALEQFERETKTKMFLGDKESYDIDIYNELPFKNKHEREKFFYEDYVFEIFGAAEEFELNLTAHLNQWSKNLAKQGHKVVLFSMDEKGLSLQSTLFYISKTGCKFRDIFFPLNAKEAFDRCDVVITANPRMMINTDKIIVGIKRGYNSKRINKTDLSYDSLFDIIDDKEFINSISKGKKENSFIKMIKNIFQK